MAPWWVKTRGKETRTQRCSKCKYQDEEFKGERYSVVPQEENLELHLKSESKLFQN
jgi:hypothetical protein